MHIEESKKKEAEDLKEAIERKRFEHLDAEFYWICEELFKTYRNQMKKFIELTQNSML